ncbi:hypothetical protein CVT26_006049 [Gymnopilus dilepis]|uniref:Uncharacterized protein n=1 Tax=Gymnopilus dilepis TaxID=231916 RepID=A0A409Y1L9_9AGAR|nr:hypothetical protein CVT26_006049 [Gymnopilus dilepis]
MHPINFLPPELLGRVFEACLPRPLPDPYKPLISSSNGHTPILLTLSHVCALWRAVAFSTPNLWNNLAYSITIRDSAASDEDSFLGGAVVEGWLAFRKKDIDFLSWWAEKVRGNNLSLKLESVWATPASSKSLVTIGDFLTTIGVHTRGQSGRLAAQDATFHQWIAPLLGLISRARRLDMEGWLFDFLSTYFGDNSSIDEGLKVYFSNLEVLSTHDGDLEGHADLGDCFDMIPLQRMSKIKALHLNNYVISDAIAYGTFAFWGRLTLLTAVVNSSFDIWRKFLKSCTSLEIACLEVCLDDYDEISAGHRDTTSDLPNLRQVEICGLDNQTAASLFNGLRFPVLKSLTLDGSYLSMENLHRLLKATPELRSLRISMLFPAMTTPEEDDLIALTGDLELIGHVQFPSFGGDVQSVDKDFLRPLSFYVPKLEILSLTLPIVHPIHPGFFESWADKMLKCGWLTDYSRLLIRVSSPFNDGRAHHQITKGIRELRHYIAKQNSLSDGLFPRISVDE